MLVKVNDKGEALFTKSELLRHVDDFDICSKDIREIVRQACSQMAKDLLEKRGIEDQAEKLLDRQIEVAIAGLQPAIQRIATNAMHLAIERRIAALARDAEIKCTISVKL